MNSTLKQINADIWYISKYAIPNNLGFGTRHFGLSSSFIKKGYKSLVITSNSNHVLKKKIDLKHIYNFKIEDGLVPTVWIKTINYQKPNSLKRIVSWIDFEVKLFFLILILKKPNVVIVSSLSILTILNGYLLKIIRRSKLIFEVRDIWPLTLTELGNFTNKNLFIKILKCVEKFGYRKSDLIIGTMPNLRNHVANLGINKKVNCIPQGFFRNKKYVKKDFKLPNKFIVCYAGGIGLSNSLETFIECSIMMKDEKNIFFVIAGDGELKNKFINQTKNNNNILFLGHIKKTYINSLLTQSDILYDSVKKSVLYEYGLSRNKWIDYMKAGKPIIASFLGYKSMINESNCGSFIRPEDPKHLKDEIYKYFNLSKFELNKIGYNGKKWINSNRQYSMLASKYLKLIYDK